MNRTIRSRVCACFALMAVSAVFAAEVTVDFDKVTGPVKPVNGVGQPPMIGKLSSWSMLHYLTEAGIPYSRLHDVGGWLGGGLFVDIPNLFPDFEADENDPKSYRFAYTDELIVKLMEHKVEPFFRLGVTIENWVDRGREPLPPLRALPPKDYAKWARICEHVIRHYTEGWNNGYTFKITYWEIWNEPDNNPEDRINPMWGAPWKTYCDFYGVVAPHLKRCFPYLKIGGYASCGFYAGPDAGKKQFSPRFEHFIVCAKAFLARARDEKWPLDFFSYHAYSSPREALRQVQYAHDLLNAYGFTAERCERINNEWLPYVTHDNLGTAKQAAGIAVELIGFQNGPCDLACIYDARCGVGNYSPLFNPLTYKPHKAYYAFVAFNELRKLGKAVTVTVSGNEALYATAAADGSGRGALMLANDSDTAIDLPATFGGKAPVAVRVIDLDRTWQEIPYAARIPARGVLLLTF